MKIIKNVDENFWWDVVQKCDYATFYHTPIWAKIASKTYSEIKSYPIGAILDNGTRIVLPLISKPGPLKGMLRVFTSSYASCYGDIIADEAVTNEERAVFYNSINNVRVGKIELTSNPFSVTHQHLKNFSERSDYTQILNLTPGYDVVRSKYKSSCRNKINKGRKQHISISYAKSMSELDCYLDIYAENLKQWGKPNSGYPKSLFHSLLEYLNHKLAHPVIWLVRSDEGNIIGGTVVFYTEWHAVEWHASFDRKWFKYGIRNLLVDEIINDACKRGCKYYDFNPSGGYEGVAKFKASFGAQKRELFRWSYISQLYKTYHWMNNNF